MADSAGFAAFIAKKKDEKDSDAKVRRTGVKAAAKKAASKK